MRRGIGRLRAGGGGFTPSDADAAAWGAAVVSNGGTVSSGTLRAVDTFCIAAKANGYWSKLNRINLICGDQLTAARVPLKVGGGNTIDTNVSFISGNYTEATGLTGNATTKFLRTGVIPSVSLTLNDTHLAVYNRSSGVTGGAHLGAFNAAAQSLSLYGPFSDSKVYSVAYTETTPLTSAVVATPYGFIVGSRTASNAHSSYRNAVSLTSEAVTAGSLPTVEEYVFARNNAGTADNLTSHVLAAYSIGSGLTAGDVTAYNTDMQAFQTALGRNV